jgi:hypothetical protein
MAQPGNLFRAAWLGACAALVIGGLGTLYVGFIRLIGAIDCAGMTLEECALEHDVYKSVGRVQAISGAAMIMLGLALYVLWRRPRSTETS